jgi:hypothetical protein
MYSAVLPDLRWSVQAHQVMRLCGTGEGGLSLAVGHFADTYGQRAVDIGDGKGIWLNRLFQDEVSDKSTARPHAGCILLVRFGFGPLPLQRQDIGVDPNGYIVLVHTGKLGNEPIRIVFLNQFDLGFVNRIEV